MNKERRKEPTEIERSYRSLVENIKDYAIFMLDKKGIIESWDQGGVKLFGYTRNEIIGKKFSVLFTEENIIRGVPDTDMQIAIQEGKHLDDRQYIKKNLTTFWSSGVLTSNKDKNGKHQGFSKIMRDVTVQKDLHMTSVHNSMHDFLSGLPNRNFFEENLLESIPRTKKGKILAVFYMDLNNFKYINDKYGHRCGDLVLIEIAHRLTHNIRVSDVAARFGGDEFVILVKNLASQKDVTRFAQKIIKAFTIPIVIEKKVIKTSVSMGVSLYPNDAIKPAELLRFADLALYQAKKLGGNQYQFYSKTNAIKKTK